ncbi:hypothetical protein F2P81_006373 [Scophthalmus maximus]|uniref:Craniofacial development protein 1 n=1 Tax=Scophthalmus maximus TaxID=52904 RepID=A0A6A4T5S0_SCOMX|nr:hypothetical protein F2P81_006373 [Scophthalmus maximus]
MIWEQIQTAKRKKYDLHVVWLDLENAFVLHKLITFALEFFHIPTCIQNLVSNSCSSFQVCYTTQETTTGWHQLEKEMDKQPYYIIISFVLREVYRQNSISSVLLVTSQSGAVKGREEAGRKHAGRLRWQCEAFSSTMNSYSDYDSDGYSSNEDADYVPSDDNLSEDDINECEKEDPLHKDDNVPHPDDGSRTKSKKKLISMRKRKKGVLKLKQEEMDGCGAEETVLPQEEVVKPTEVKEVDDERQKKKSDDLWASFLSDVGTRPKESTAAPQSSIIQKADSSASKAAPLTTETKAAEPATVTITKVFDFAGEEVSAKRPAGVSSILSRFGGKKQKMSTLEKSKMDWDAFKSEEGITEELAIHNRGKEGFVERKNFLERVDHRQFELEKAVKMLRVVVSIDGFGGSDKTCWNGFVEFDKALWCCAPHLTTFDIDKIGRSFALKHKELMNSRVQLVDRQQAMNHLDVFCPAIKESTLQFQLQLSQQIYASATGGEVYAPCGSETVPKQTPLVCWGFFCGDGASLNIDQRFSRGFVPQRF